MSIDFAYIFDGQGAQKPGMGRELYDAYPVYRDAFDAYDPTGTIAELCFNGTEEQLADTRNTQPCMVCMELATVALMESVGLHAKMSYGLSLGEYAALGAAGVLEGREAVELVTFRGEVMHEAAQGYDCGMTAVLGLSDELVKQSCKEASHAGFVAPTNYNCPGQIVISGEKDAVELASQKALELGAKRCIPLAVSGPFHTALMASAGEKIAERFESVNFGEMKIPVLFNTTAKPLEDGKTIAEMLADQVQSPVHFDGCVQTMIDMGITTTVEVGPGGNPLSKFVKKVDKSVQTLSVSDPESFEKTKETLL